VKKNYCFYKFNPCNGCYILGPTGPRGDKGDVGPAPDFYIGNVTTGLPGTQASVKITAINEDLIKINLKKDVRRKDYGQ